MLVVVLQYFISIIQITLLEWLTKDSCKLLPFGNMIIFFVCKISYFGHKTPCLQCIRTCTIEILLLLTQELFLLLFLLLFCCAASTFHLQTGSWLLCCDNSGSFQTAS